MSNPYGDEAMRYMNSGDYQGEEETTALACDTCGSAMVLVSGNDECPLCDSIPSNNKPAALYQAGTHPAFVDTWMGRVSAVVSDEETTERIEPESMAKVVAR